MKRLALFLLCSAAVAMGAELTLFWTDNSDNETGFYIERSVDGSSFFRFSTVGANTETFTDTGLLNEVQYWYRVQAFNSAGNSDYSNIATATTDPLELPPTAPGGTGIREQGELTNISYRSKIVTVEGAAVIGGFVVADAPVKVLVRGVGPGLIDYGVPNTLSDPMLTLVLADGSPMGSNDNWAGQEVVDASAAVGAFALVEGSLDAAFVVTLPPGVYTVRLEGVGGLEGVALMEIYKVP